jgi:hypothetical protein
MTVDETKMIRVAGRAYTAFLIPGTEQHPCYVTGDVDAAVRRLRYKREAFDVEIHNDPNLVRWRLELDRKLDEYQDESESWRMRRTG